MALYDHIIACNAHDLANFQPFIVASAQVGWVRTDVAEALHQWPQFFELSGDCVTLRDSVGGVDARSAAMHQIGSALVAQQLLPEARDELFAVAAHFHDRALLRLDRAWVPAFGVAAYGVHVNGYVDAPSGPELWVGVRSADSDVDPGKLDNMVAGGQPAGLSLEQNIVKEAEEEASVPEALARQARPVGALSYTKEVPQGLRRDMLYIYDLPLPADFRPVSRDGEHTGFSKITATQALQIVDEGDAFKFNVNLVIIDFAIRHGILAPDHRDYVRLLRGLRSWD